MAVCCLASSRDSVRLHRCRYRLHHGPRRRAARSQTIADAIRRPDCDEQAREFRDGSLGPRRQRGFRDDECQETFGEQSRRRRTLYFDADFAEHSLLGSPVLLYAFSPAPYRRRAGHGLTALCLTNLSFSKRVP